MRAYYIKKRHLKDVALALSCIAVWMFVAIFADFGVLPTMSSDPIYSGSETGGMASFAINVDWGEEYIPDMLDLFDEKDIKVTFFLTGRWTDKNPDLAREIVRRGHEIGNHAYSHKSPNSMSQEENQKEIQRTAAVIKTVTGVDTMLYAPPSGERESQVLAAAAAEHHVTILWSVDTIDWQKPSVATMQERVLTKAKPGCIILMHPTENTLAALPGMIEQLQERGLTLGTVSATCRLEQLPAEEPQPESKNKSNQPLQPLVPRY